MGVGRKPSLAEHTERERKKASNRGNRGNWAGRLKNWHAKDAITKTRSGNKVASIDILLASRADLVELAVHSWPKVITKKEKDSNKEETDCFNSDFNCFEDIVVVEEQNKFDDQGRRLAPPVICPHCRFLDWVRLQIEEGELSWTEKIFRYRSDKNNVTLHAGGICGKFGGWDLTDDDKDELKEAGINLREAFKENAMGKSKFIYCFVDLGDLDKGLQVTMESKTLGNQLSALIDERKDEFGEAGDPTLNPYPFRFRFEPEEKPQDMYSVSYVPWADLEGTGFKEKEQAIELAKGTKIPAVFEQLRKYPNVKQLRIQMESACLLKDVPWDEIFAPVEARADDKGWVKDDEEIARDDEETSSSEVESSKKSDGGASAADGDETVDCGNCGKQVSFDASKCPHCGAEFDEEPEEEKPAKKSEPPPAKTKTTETVEKARAAGRSGARGGGRRGGAKAKPDVSKEPGQGDDDVPWE